MCRGELYFLTTEPVSDVPYAGVELEKNLATHLLKTIFDIWIIEALTVLIKENVVVTICICQML